MTALLKRLASRPVPTGRLARLWSLSSLQLKAVSRLGAAWVQGAFRSQDVKERVKNEARVRAAFDVLSGMAYLRGAAAKIGQALALYPEVVPEQVGDVLGALQFQAPPMHFSLLRELVRDELGADPEELFAEFETEAFAAASLGQVHRARLTSGERVAVKIQYPNIARTIESDLANLKAIMTPMRLTKNWDSLVTQLDDVRVTLVAETNYSREAEYGARARVALADYDGVVVPKVIAERSSDRVLTTEFLDGVHLDAYLATNPSQDDRDQFGARLFGSSARLFYGARMVHADPHPGNYLFMPDGRLGLIDFGCCRVFDEAEWALIELGTEALVKDDDAILDRAILAGTGAEEGFYSAEQLADIRGTVDWLWEAIRKDDVFDFDDAYMRRGIEAYRKATASGCTRALPLNTWTNRMFWGCRSLLHRLRPLVNMRRVHDGELERAGLA